jgi:cell division septation protein DedD
VSDFTVPSYRVRPQRAGFQVPWRMVAMAGAIIGAAGAGGAVVWGIARAVNREVPTIEADERPIRVKPEDPGGLRVANQDERIFDRSRRGAGGVATGQARLTPEPESPDLEALRQAAARAQQRAQASQAAAQAPVQPDTPPARPPLANPSFGPQAAHPAAPVSAPTQPAQQQQAQQAVAQPEPQVPAITPPPMPASTPVRTGRFIVQLGAVGSEEAARGEWARLQGRIPELSGRQPHFTKVDRGDQPPMWRIRTGGLPDAAAARELCEAAKAKSAPCAVIGG